jgi:release factor glutamine methyltransferase
MVAVSDINRGEAFRRGIMLLKRAGIPNPTVDASVLLGHITGENAATVLLERKTVLTSREAGLFKELIQRRCRHEVSSRLVGKKEFFSRMFRVTTDVLDPRPETEILVEKALDCLRDCPGQSRILDVGTGSGVIAVTLAAENPGVLVAATDISPAALKLALANAMDHRVSDRVRFIRTELALGVKDEKCFDLLISNPPYVSQAEYPSLPVEVIHGDPVEALVSGPEGTEFYPALVGIAVRILKPGGYLLLEVGAGHSPLVKELFLKAGFADVEVFQDLAGMPRVVKGVI